MGAVSSNSISAVSEINQTMLNTSNNECYSTSSVSVTDNTYNIVCTGHCDNINGINISGSLNSTCSVLQSASQLATNNIATQLEQSSKVESDLFNDFLLLNRSHNSADMLQSVVNSNISTASNLCSSDSYIDSSNNVVNITAGSAGNVNGIIISADANSSCQIQALSKMAAYNSLQAAVSQKSKVMGMFVAIITTLIMGLVVVVIAVVILFASGTIITGVTKAISTSKQQKQDRGTSESDTLDDVISDAEAMTSDL